MGMIRSLALIIIFCASACTIPESSRSSQTSSSSQTTPSAASRASLSDPRVQSKVASLELLRKINTLLVMPVTFQERVTDLGSDSSYITDELEQSAEAELGMSILTKSKVTEKGGVLTATMTQAQGLELARRLSADSVLITTINNFRERVGSAVGGQPGNLNFTMNVVSALDGRTIWSANYHFKDEALFSNLLKVGDRFDKDSGAGWKDTRLVLRKGFGETLADLSERRFKAFTQKDQ